MTESPLETPPMALSDASGVPYYRQIKDQISQFIRSGLLAPGSRLPSVRDLAKSLLVSLITVRRSYADLEAAGLIVRRQGQGTFVAEKVETASREQAAAEAQARLRESIALARQLGMDSGEIKKIVGDILDERGKRDDQK